MKEHLPFQAQWSVKVLQWLVTRNLSLEELLTDEDVLAGVVSFFTKKVQCDNDPQAPQDEGEINKLAEELDFVKCRLAGADQQRQNEVTRLEDRNAELREEIVKLTQKLKASEKEIFESRFSVGKVKAELRKTEEEARDFRRDNDKKDNKIKELEQQIQNFEDQRSRVDKNASEVHRKLDEQKRNHQSQLENARQQYTKEKSKLEFLVEERDNALSEAREGQAAATREIENMRKELDKAENRLSLLEMEAIEKGVPMIRVGDNPVVGHTVAEAMKKENGKVAVIDEEDVDNDNWSKKSKKNNRTPEPSSSIQLGKNGEGLDLSNDTRLPELHSIELDESTTESASEDFSLDEIDYTGSSYSLGETSSIKSEPEQKQLETKKSTKSRHRKNTKSPAKNLKTDSKMEKPKIKKTEVQAGAKVKPVKTVEKVAPGKVTKEASKDRTKTPVKETGRNNQQVMKQPPASLPVKPLDALPVNNSKKIETNSSQKKKAVSESVAKHSEKSSKSAEIESPKKTPAKAKSRRKPTESSKTSTENSAVETRKTAEKVDVNEDKKTDIKAAPKTTDKKSSSARAGKTTSKGSSKSGKTSKTKKTDEKSTVESDAKNSVKPKPEKEK
ncbi:MAG: hypothetical protein JXR95_14855 [Deltaproteobacteria bacterium]|nr:hypothetical protein [Deltaproteobacteria bacterium]